MLARNLDRGPVYVDWICGVGGDEYCEGAKGLVYGSDVRGCECAIECVCVERVGLSPELHSSPAKVRLLEKVMGEVRVCLPAI